MSKHDRDEDPRTTKAREQYLGKEYSFNNGDPNIKMKVVEFDNYRKVTVQVGDTDTYITASMGDIKIGNVYNPFKENCPIGFTEPKYEYIGCVFRTNQGYFVKILSCEDRDHAVYEFLDSGYQDVTSIYNIINGQVKNPYHKNKFGGYLGPDKTYRKKEFEWVKKIWDSLLLRCADSKERHDVLIDIRWYCYGMFAQWYMYYYSQLSPEYKYEIDKDLKYPVYSQFTCGKRYYGPDTCILIPKELSSMLKVENHDNIKNAARYYKEQNALLDEAYNIIMNM
jgi:hypothetical protein